MKIALVTPAPAGSTKGNRISANRYATLLRELGHTVHVSTEYDSRDADALVALHARRSGRSVQRFHRLHPERSIIVVLTGTDLYHDLPGNKTALRSLEIADRLVTLQPLGIEALPARYRKKAVSIIQSAEAFPETWAEDRAAAAERRKRTGRFRVLQLAHLRPVKDPFLIARATRFLREDSAVEIHHAGEALQPGSSERALRLMHTNPRYAWVGNCSHRSAKRRLAKSDLLVLSSKLEGGANVICEALAVEVPVVCSRIPGSVGLLGRDYPGYFPVGDAKALARLLVIASTDGIAYGRLERACRMLKKLVTPARERSHGRRLLRSCRVGRRTDQL